MRLTKYYKVKNGSTEESTHLKAEMVYRLGGFNLFTYKQEKRGYYISVTPVTRFKMGDYSGERFTAFTGYGKLVFEATRRTKKQSEKAKEYFEKNALAFVKQCFPGVAIDEIPEIEREEM